MSANQTNNLVAIPVPGGGIVGTTDGGGVGQLAMRMMQETGAPSVILKIAPDNNPSDVTTARIDRDGNCRVLHSTNDPPANN